MDHTNVLLALFEVARKEKKNEDTEKETISESMPLGFCCLSFGNPLECQGLTETDPGRPHLSHRGKAIPLCTRRRSN